MDEDCLEPFNDRDDEADVQSKKVDLLGVRRRQRLPFGSVISHCAVG